MPRRFDPLSNLGTSRVFYGLAIGFTTTGKLSQELKIKPPTVSEHLQRLVRVKIVSLGEKKGHFQYYRINWDKIIEVFTNKFSDPFSALVGSFWARETWELYWKKKKPAFKNEKEVHPIIEKKIENFFNKLKKNKYFKDLIINYFCLLSEDMVDVQTTHSVSEAIEEFEKALLVFYPDIKKKKFKDKKEKEFVILLGKWYDGIKNFMDFPRAALKHSFWEMKLM